MKFKYVIFFLCSIFYPVRLSAHAQPAVTPAIRDVLYSPSSVTLGGFVGEKMTASYENRILAQDAARLVAPFRVREEKDLWQSEFWGKWFTSAVLAYKYHPTTQLKEKLDETVTDLISTQTADGYIGNYASDKHLDGWDIWGRKYCMLGLIAYYDLTKDKKTLKAAGKVADHLMSELKDCNIVQRGAHRGMAASSVLEPICLLYARTGAKRYLDFAELIVRQWEAPDGPRLISKADVDVALRFPRPEVWYGADQGQKAYEMMSCYEGLLELYRLTGKEAYKIAVEKTWENINNTEINIVGSGSSVECWFGGKKKQTIPVYHYQETCVTVTWIKLCQQLLRLTGDIKYAEAIEQSFYNALLGAMKPDGSAWAYYTPLLSGYRVIRGEQCHMGTNCCNASGPRGLFLFPPTMAMTTDQGVQVHFFGEGETILKTPHNQSLTLVQKTDYPESGKIRIQVDLPRQEEMDIRIRIPAWSKRHTMTVNGETIKSLSTGQYATLSRIWKPGDVIELALDMRGRVIETGEYRQHVALVRGPIVLARDIRQQGPVFDTWIKPETDADGYLKVELEKVNQQGFWMQFKVMASCESSESVFTKPEPVMMCDFASSGNTYDKTSRFRVWFDRLFNAMTD